MVQVKLEAMVVNMEVVWAKVVFMGILALLTGQCSAEKRVLLLCRHSDEAQSVGYIQDLFSFYP